MGILNRIFKKKDDFDFDKPISSPEELGLPPFETPTASGPSSSSEFADPGISPLRTYQPPTFGPPPGTQQAPPPQFQQLGISSRDVELILTKLENINSILKNLDIRIANLERIAGAAEQDKQGYRW